MRELVWGLEKGKEETHRSILKLQAALLGKEGRKPRDAQKIAVSVQAWRLLGHTCCYSAPHFPHENLKFWGDGSCPSHLRVLLPPHPAFQKVSGARRATSQETVWSPPTHPKGLLWLHHLGHSLDILYISFLLCTDPPESISD